MIFLLKRKTKKFGSISPAVENVLRIWEWIEEIGSDCKCVRRKRSNSEKDLRPKASRPRKPRSRCREKEGWGCSRLRREANGGEAISKCGAGPVGGGGISRGSREAGGDWDRGRLWKQVRLRGWWNSWHAAADSSCRNSCNSWYALVSCRQGSQLQLPLLWSLSSRWRCCWRPRGRAGSCRSRSFGSLRIRPRSSRSWRSCCWRRRPCSCTWASGVGSLNDTGKEKNQID